MPGACITATYALSMAVSCWQASMSPNLSAWQEGAIGARRGEAAAPPRVGRLSLFPPVPLFNVRSTNVAKDLELVI